MVGALLGQHWLFFCIFKVSDSKNFQEIFIQHFVLAGIAQKYYNKQNNLKL